MICVSIVNHNHDKQVINLLKKISSFPQVKKIILTNNLKNKEFKKFKSKKIYYLNNQKIQGFGVNHNKAFSKCNNTYFCVLNPDVKIIKNPFGILINEIKTNKASVIAPVALDNKKKFQDNFRFFPTPVSLLKKLIFGTKGNYNLITFKKTLKIEWVSGMFMLFKSKDFKKIGGFDSRFFMYYEDIDICTRLWSKNLKVYGTIKAQVEHKGDRKSHRNLKYFKIHIASILIFFYKHLFRFPNIKKI